MCLEEAQCDITCSRGCCKHVPIDRLVTLAVRDVRFGGVCVCVCVCERESELDRELFISADFSQLRSVDTKFRAEIKGNANTKNKEEKLVFFSAKSDMKF